MAHANNFISMNRLLGKDQIKNKPTKQIFHDSEDEDEKSKQLKKADSVKFSCNKLFADDNDVKNKKIKKDDLDSSDDEMERNFNKALEKEIYKGKKGRMLFELQQQSKGDQRFQFKNSFKNDVDVSKVSKNIKSFTDSFDNQNIEYKQSNSLENRHEKKSEKLNGVHHLKNDNNDNIIEYSIEKIKSEKDNYLTLCKSLISNEEFFGHQINKRNINSHKLIIQRYDPAIGLGSHLIINQSNLSNGDHKEGNKDKEKGAIKINKLKSGFEKYSEVKHENELNKQKYFNEKEKQKDLSDVINKIQDTELKEIKVDIDYGFFKNLSILSSSNNEDAKTQKSIEKESDNSVLLGKKINKPKKGVKQILSDSNKDKEKLNKKVVKKINDKSDRIETDNKGENANLHLVESVQINDDDIINNKIETKRKTSEKGDKNYINTSDVQNTNNLQNSQKNLSNKNLEKKKKDEKIKNKLKKKLLQTNDSSKVDNYMRMVDMVIEKKFVQKKN